MEVKSPKSDTKTDVSPQRHANMAAIHSEDTKPEMMVRRYLWHKGFRYRINDKRLPGRPDIVLSSYHTVIFIHGCFWHAHEGCKHFRVPKTNQAFWEAKFARNKERDLRDHEQLRRMGWNILTIWECQLRDHPQETLQDIENVLLKNFLIIHRAAARMVPDNPKD